jgi:hypothetical protein
VPATPTGSNNVTMSEATGSDQPPDPRLSRRRRRIKALVIAAVAVGREVFSLRRLGYGFGGRVIVRCGQGHLFTTIWIPAASVKSLRFGMRRFQRCPVGRHWAIVTPVPASELSDDERCQAAATRDIPLP